MLLLKTFVDVLLILRLLESQSSLHRKHSSGAAGDSRTASTWLRYHCATCLYHLPVPNAERTVTLAPTAVTPKASRTL